MAAKEVWYLQEHATTFRILAGATAARQNWKRSFISHPYLVFSNIQVRWTLRICSITGDCLKIITLLTW